MKGSGVRVLKILGRDYSIRAGEGEASALLEAAEMLQKRLSEGRRQFPNASNDELLVLTALNLWVPLIQQGRQLSEAQQRLAETVERITRQLQTSAGSIDSGA